MQVQKASLIQANLLFITTQQTSDLLFFDGMADFHEANYDQAIQKFSSALKVVSNYQAAAYYRAKAYEKKGDIKKALSDLKSLKAAHDKDSEALYEAWNIKKNR